MVHTGLVTISGTGVLVIDVKVSVGLNPLPVTVTAVPITPEVGVRDIVGVDAATVKTAEAE